MSFAAPDLLWLLILVPLAGVAWAALWRRRLRADAAWASRGLWDRLLPAYDPRRINLSLAFLILALIGVAFALARPRWGTSTQTVERRGVDVVFLVDSSMSMAAQDVPPSRLFVARSLVQRMSRAMPGNRIGLIQMEGRGVVLAPLTLDSAVIDLLLDAVQPGSLPEPGTELASGFDTALKLFGEGGDKHRALVVLSDGEDHGGRLDDAVQRLKEEGVVIYTLGIGTPQGSRLPVPGLAGGTGGGGPPTFKRDRDGREVISRLNEESLEDAARATGGSYQRITTAGADVTPILRRIDRLEKQSLESQTLSTHEERFQWPLTAAVLGLLLYLAVGPFRQEEPA
jgi:Ca-activated chloride channel family protein